MAESKRIFWTDYEQSEVYRVFTELVEQKKIKDRPVPNSYSRDGSLVMSLLRQAQLVLPENRRRSLANIEALTPELGERLALHGYFPKNWRTFYKKKIEQRKEAAAEVDPQAKLIQELQARVAELEQRIKDSEEQREGLSQALVNLRNQPTFGEQLQSWIADTLALALTRAEDMKKPTFMRPAGGQASPEGKSTSSK